MKLTSVKRLTQATLKSGAVIPCDMHIASYSLGPNTDYAPAAMLDDKRYVKVTEFMNTPVISTVECQLPSCI